MKILFVMRSSIYVRNFESTLRMLADRGHQVRVVAPIHWMFDAQPLILRLAQDHPAITHAPPPTGPVHKWAAASEELRRGVDYLRYLGPEYLQAPKLVHRAELYAPPFLLAALKRPMARSPVGLAAIDRTLRLTERAMPIDPVVKDFVAAERPDLLIVTPLIEPGSPQAQYLRAARSLGITTALCVYSWDNLTNKGLIQDPVDLVTVWNEPMRREAVELHGLAEDRVVVTGAQSYDQWFEWKPQRTREEFCRHAGLPTDRPYLLYLCSSKFIAPHEARFVRRWIEDIRRTSPILARLGILIRPHPQYGNQWENSDIAAFDAVSIWPRQGANPVDVESRSDFYESIFYSTAVVGVNTSAQIESAIVGRSVYSLLSPEFQDTQEGTLHFHHLRNVNGGMLHVAPTLADHVAQLEEAVARAGVDDGRCRRFVEGFVRPYGIDVAATPRLVAAIEQAGAKRPARRERAPWYAGLIFSRLESFAEVCARQEELQRAKDLEPRGGRVAAKKKAKRRVDPSTPGSAAAARPVKEVKAARKKKAQALDQEFQQRLATTYDEVRDMVRRMKTAAAVTTGLPELQPLWHATPEMLMRLRQFGACVGGAAPADYVDASEPAKRLFRSLVRKLTHEAGDGPVICEPRRLGCFGFAREGTVHTADTLRYIEVLTALRFGAALPPASDSGVRPVVWEIGGGWGGFAYHFKSLFPRVTYVISSHPDQMLLSATYLRALFPRAVVRAYGEGGDAEPWRQLKKADFVFVPESAVQSIPLPSVNLVIDLMALERLAPAAIDAHVRVAFDLASPFFYSALPAPTTAAASAVRDALMRYYWLYELPVARGPNRRPLTPWPPPAADGPLPISRSHVIGWKRMVIE